MDRAGKIFREAASWTLQPIDGGAPIPAVIVAYPVAADVAQPRPNSLVYFGLVLASPLPASPTATVEIQIDGEVVAHKPWMLYAKNWAALKQQPASGPKPVALMGAAPFDEAEGAALFDRIATGRGRRLSTRLVGQSGETIMSRDFELGAPPVADRDALARELKIARDKAGAPDHCARPVTRRGD